MAAHFNKRKAEAIRRALTERQERLVLPQTKAGRAEKIAAVLRDRIWPQIPPDIFGKPVSRGEREAILGYGPDGV